MNRLLSIIIAVIMLCAAVPAAAEGGIEIFEASGGLETICVRWTNSAAADGYGVYVKPASGGEYTRIDNELVRYYGSYYRADIPGLKAGDYTVKVEAVGGASAETGIVSVKPHIREGFAFSGGTASGGYNNDGTVKPGARIIYVCADNLGSVKTTIDGKEITGFSGILDDLRKTSDPCIIRIIGTIGGGTYELKEIKNLTVEGIGSDATLYKAAFRLNNCNNVEIRNLGVMLFPDDGIAIESSSRHIWVHNCDLFYGSVGSDADQVKGDGSIDIKKKTTNVTLSFNHFWDSGKCSLVQANSKSNSGDGTDLLTYHHNWFDHSDSRHPRIRYSTVHLYNNYFDGNSNYGSAVTSGASAFTESNYYRNCKYPMISSMQGSDIRESSSGNLSKEAGGIFKAYNNIVIGGNVEYYSDTNKKEFDAYLAKTRDEKVPETVTTKKNTFVKNGTTYTYKSTYNNFDTAAGMYSYEPDSAENVPQIVTEYAGRYFGGDFAYYFNNEIHDADHGVNEELKAQITNYKSSIKSQYVTAGSTYPATTGEVPTPAPKPTVGPSPTATPEVTVSPSPTATPEATVSPEPEYNWEIVSYKDGTVEFTAPAGTNEVVYVFAAAYADNGALSDYSYSAVTAVPGVNSVKLPKKIDNAKIMLWNERLAPLCD